jgi:hypothetical protein
MQVTINIDANQIGETVVDLFKNLSQEKKEELAKEVVKKYLDDKVRERLGWSECLISKLYEKIDDYFINDITNNPVFKETKEKCIEILNEKMPEIIMKSMIIVFSSNIISAGYKLQDLALKDLKLDSDIKEIKQRLGIPIY